MGPVEQPPRDLAEVRAAIDDIDTELVRQLAAREALVRRAAALKSDEDGVRAPGRVAEVIDRVRSLAMAAGATPEVVEAVYRAMIRSFIELELREVHRRRPPGGPA